MLPNEIPAKAVDRLLLELKRHRAKEGAHREQHYVKQLKPVYQQLRDVPLLHGTKADGFDGALSNGSLRSRQALGRKPSEAESYLGITSAVYTSAGVLYPDRNFAFILSPRVEASVGAEACPWDSGAMCRSLCEGLLRPMPDPRRREVFLAHTVPAPEYRQYLVHYVASCFHSATAYLERRRHQFSDPLGALCDDWASRIFEVRLGADVLLDALSLEAVFVPKDGLGATSLRLRRKLNALEQAGVQIYHHDPTRNQLRWVVKDWVLDRARAVTGGPA